MDIKCHVNVVVWILVSAVELITGKLQWEDVKPVIEWYLEDRFTVVSFDHE